MSAVPAERIIHARDLRFAAPPEQMKKVFADLARLRRELEGALSEEGLVDFASDVLDALFASQQKNDLRPLNEVIDAWYRSLLFARRDGFFEKLEEAEGTMEEEPSYTLDEVRRRLRV